MISTWMFIAYGLIGGLVAVVLPCLCLCCLGFTCGGVRGNSYASGWQSGIGDVEAGSCFAMCQSAGACGSGCCRNLILFVLGFAGTIAVLYFTSPGSEFDPNISNSTLDWNSTSDYVYDITTPHLK
ncbi:uncharacterized protein NPIL_622032 [Nephila pilipes]|uniref:Uncharacterized protein n=1 Tax=Nephila pilipes TaxID=299642 RepID=A0A8X6UNB0_NEPPI|nr:uncharacterized protein NPIL_622032 [Nephila pilipes]